MTTKTLVYRQLALIMMSSSLYSQVSHRVLNPLLGRIAPFLGITNAKRTQLIDVVLLIICYADLKARFTL